MLDKKPIEYDCFFCERPYPFGPDAYEGRPIKLYRISICDACSASFAMSVPPHYEGKLRSHLKIEGLPEPELHSDGLIYLPYRGQM